MDFSWKGCVVVVLVLLPNVLYLTLPRNNVPADLRETHVLVTILEQVFRIAYFVIAILFTRDARVSRLSPFLFLAGFFLLAYYALWIRYFAGGADFRSLFDTVLWIPLPMAVFPILFLLFSALWLRSVPLVAASVLFAVPHLLAASGVARQL
jgi:hypothetical protein